MFARVIVIAIDYGISVQPFGHENRQASRGEADRYLKKLVLLAVVDFVVVLLAGCSSVMPEISRVFIKPSPNTVEVNLIVLTEQGESIKGAKVQFIFDGAPEPRWTDDNGYVRVEIPQRDDIDVVITKEGFETSTQTMNLETGERRTIPYRLKQEEQSSTYPALKNSSVLSKSIIPTPPVINIDRPLGSFTDDSWLLHLSYENDIYYYEGIEISTGDSLKLKKTRLSVKTNRKIYIWKNGEYKYQVVWQPNEPHFVRLQVFDHNDKELTNKLLEKIN